MADVQLSVSITWM